MKSQSLSAASLTALLAGTASVAAVDPSTAQPDQCHGRDANAVFSSHQCALLSQQKELAGRVYAPQAAEYAAQQATYWSLDNALRGPECIVLPQSAEEVAAAVKALSTGGNSRPPPRCQFAVRSAGHMANAGANNIHTGVTIDLGYTNSTVYKPELKVASIGPGARWGSVYSGLAKSEVMVVGGRASTVGVGGLVLGSGNSFYGAQRGFACDNVANFEVVLADGSIVNANQTSRPDLYKALKGGSSNFGIVTRLDLETFQPPSTLWGGVMGWTSAATPAVIKAMKNFGDGASDHTDSSSIVFWTYTQGAGAPEPIVMALLHNTAGVPEAPQYQEFLSIPNPVVKSIRKDSLVNLVAELEVPSGLYNTWQVLAFKNSEAALLQPLSARQLSLGARTGGNVLGLEDRTETLMMFLGMTAYKDAAQKEYVDRKMAAWTASISEFAKTQGVDDKFLFLNYAGLNQSPLRSYGEKNLEFMRKVAAKYDPTQVFQNRVPGGFKLKNA
ncbi:FAD binding domain-containing protein [Magnaporthiopsis poae ATCC 64411]|uniref:FAD binding domain-containing protein n=1 Tax=Magnaporthiopsis poae (strain ATCC 64411 / 73-15) TaxID=644358 RepID=A0A0C4DVY1_MAGP6|nr:FAD binding domain-containing protein [Magnaporthiopsis poae ATCC 64411]